MKKLITICAVVTLLLIANMAVANGTWVTFQFTDADLWNYDAYDSSANDAKGQSAPRRHHDVWKSSGITTTWLYDGNPSGEAGTVDIDYPDVGHLIIPSELSPTFTIVFHFQVFALINGIKDDDIISKIFFHYVSPSTNDICIQSIKG